METYNNVCEDGNSLYLGKYHKVRQIKTLKEFIAGSHKLYKENTAFLTKDKKGGDYREITYDSFKGDVDALGTKLIDMGLKGRKIAVIGENCYDWVTAYFAVTAGTGVIVPLDKELSKEEIKRLIDTAECSAVFYTNTYSKIFENIDIEFKFEMSVYEDMRSNQNEAEIRNLIESGKELIESGDRRFIDAEVAPEQLCSLIFTSGTTGTPKAVMLSHNNIASNIMNTAKIFEIKETDRSLSILPIHHTFESTIGIMGLLFKGGSIAFFEGLRYLNKNLTEAQCTVLIGVPLIFENLYAKIWKTAKKEKKDKLLKNAVKMGRTLKAVGIDAHKLLFKSVYKPLGGKLRIILSGAAALDPKVARGFHDLGFVFSQGYGLTETAPLVAGIPDFETYINGYKKAGSCGPALPQGELRIDRPNDDGIGEIMYKGPNVMMGYYNMPEETAEVLQDGWFATGDLGFLDENGWLYITGGKKNVIVTKTGKNIYPEEIEKYLADIDYISECMVYGTDSEDGNDTIVSVQVRINDEAVEEAIGKNYSDEEVYKLIRAEIADINMKLPNWKRIRHIVIRKTDFIKTTTKKIKRQDNIELLDEDMFTLK